MSKKKTVKTDPKMWKALEKTAETFRTIFITQKMRVGLNNYRAHGASTQVDFLADFVLMIRKLYPLAESRRSFWMWLFSKPITVDGKEFKRGSEAFAVRVGSEIIKRHLVPSEYFRTVIRTKSTDFSKSHDDTISKLESVVSRYNRLRAAYRAAHPKEPEPSCYQESQESQETQSDIVGEVVGNGNAEQISIEVPDPFERQNLGAYGECE